MTPPPPHFGLAGRGVRQHSSKVCIFRESEQGFRIRFRARTSQQVSSMNTCILGCTEVTNDVFASRESGQLIRWAPKAVFVEVLHVYIPLPFRNFRAQHLRLSPGGGFGPESSLACVPRCSLFGAGPPRICNSAAYRGFTKRDECKVQMLRLLRKVDMKVGCR